LICSCQENPGPLEVKGQISFHDKVTVALYDYTGIVYVRSKFIALVTSNSEGITNDTKLSLDKITQHANFWAFLLNAHDFQ